MGRPAPVNAASLYAVSHTRGLACAPSTCTTTPPHPASSRARISVTCAAGKGKSKQGADAQQPKGRTPGKAVEPASPAPTNPHAEGEGEWEDGEELVFDVDEDELAELDEEGEGEDGFFDDEEDEFGEGEDGLGLEVEETAPGVSTGGQSWAEAALAAARKVLGAPSMSQLQLYVFR